MLLIRKLILFPPFHVQPGFDWGQVDTNALAKCLLTLCRELKDTLCLEPRLVKLKSPVYILGKKSVIYIMKYIDFLFYFTIIHRKEEIIVV